MRHQSNALWPAGVCSSMYGDNISTDTHDTLAQARGVCEGLQREGFGGKGKHFPLRTWTSEVQQPPKVPVEVETKKQPHFLQGAKIEVVKWPKL